MCKILFALNLIDELLTQHLMADSGGGGAGGATLSESDPGHHFLLSLILK